MNTETLELMVSIEEKHTISVWVSEGKSGTWWQTVYYFRNSKLESVHRYIDGVRQGITEVYNNHRLVAEVVYVQDEYKKIRMCSNQSPETNPVWKRAMNLLDDSK